MKSSTDVTSPEPGAGAAGVGAAGAAGVRCLPLLLVLLDQGLLLLSLLLLLLQLLVLLRNHGFELLNAVAQERAPAREVPELLSP